LRVMKRYHLVADPDGPRPIGQVLCGAFAGPGSRAMAASSTEPTCLPFAGWGVFRYVNGDWRVIPGGRHPIILSLGISKSGDRIVEKATIRYPGETICLASGVRARAWHWNGSRLVAGPWKVISTGPKTVHLFYIRSPSHNIWCDIGDEDRAYCVSKNLPHSATLTLTGTLTICNGPSCVANHRLFGSGTPVLAYGHQDVQGGYRCKSEEIGMTCTVISGVGKGKGFLINRAGVKQVGPLTEKAD
jgi:hypothetical protein